MVFFNCELTYQHVVSPLFARLFAPADRLQRRSSRGKICTSIPA
jgi:hypothetical protein